MKSKEKKELLKVIKKAAGIISSAKDNDEAGVNIRNMSRRERRLILKSEKKIVDKKAKEILNREK